VEVPVLARHVRRSLPVVEHDNRFCKLCLSDPENRDLGEHLKSLQSTPAMHDRSRVTAGRTAPMKNLHAVASGRRGGPHARVGPQWPASRRHD
jgi:hypothetical protein